MKRLVGWLVTIYTFIVMFYGIIIKFTINYNILFTLKTIVPELILSTIILIISISTIKNKTLLKNKSFSLLIVYLVFIVIMNLFTLPTTVQILSVIKEFLLPIIVCYLISQVEFDKELIEIIFKRLSKILIIFTILGFILATIQLNKDWEWTSKFYTGYSFYGLDPYSKVKIWHTSGKLRVPSLTGNSASFGFYNVIAFIFIYKLNINKSYKVSILTMNILNILMSTNKTALISIISIICIILAKRFKNISKINFIICILFTCTILIYFILKYNLNLIFSMLERFKFWENTLTSIGFINLIIPLNLFNTTSAAQNTGFLNTLDSTYIYMYLSIGFFGLILFIYNILKFMNKNKNNEIVRYMIITFFISSLTVNLTQGRAFFNFICLIVPLFSINNSYENLNNYY